MNPLESDIKFLKGVGEVRARQLRKLNIETIADLLEYFPRDYIDRQAKSRIKELIPDEKCAIVGTLVSIDKRSYGKGKSQLNIMISDGNDLLLCTWFRFGKWLIDKLEIGEKIWVSGNVTSFKGRFQFIHPDFEILDDTHTHHFWNTRSILPVYALTEGIGMNLMRQIVYTAFKLYSDNIKEILPDHILQKYDFPDRNKALQKMHFSTMPNEIESIKKRFAFEELFFTQLMLGRVKSGHQNKNNGYTFQLKKTFTSRLKNSLPFKLTSAQKRVIREIVSDMNSSRQMNRLLQGDVGSGKTIVTVFAMLLSIENGFQSVLMAPTELLAEQHYRSIKSLLHNQPEIEIALLKGGNYKGKKETKNRIAEGTIQIIIGTHALIQKDIKYHNVGFVAIDEQHRFGVKQRAVLVGKNRHPDLLYLSATPIPRSLALTVYGDLEVSILDEMPPDRKPVKTFWRSSSKKKIVYEEIRNELKAGRQVYIVCPLIEESEKMDLLDAETLYQQVSEKIFPEFKSTLLHGRMKTDEKDRIMNEFQTGKTMILVSTTVIEVGIDVANATVMMIEHSERFGLSQLHQLRGRVGRGSDRSFCYLISYSPISNDGRERLNTMVSTNDGFKIAEKDLELRGPGDFFGTAQSGIPAFKHANLITDQNLLKQARILAFQIVEEDAEFKLEKNNILRKTYFPEYAEKEKLFEF